MGIPLMVWAVTRMNFKPDIELYATLTQEVIYDDLLSNLGDSIVKVEKKLSYYSRKSVATLLRTGTLDFVNGSSNPRLYELKVKSMASPLRFVCALEERTIILLDVIYSSGSNGAVERRLSRAGLRLAEWRTRN